MYAADTGEGIDPFAVKLEFLSHVRVPFQYFEGIVTLNVSGDSLAANKPHDEGLPPSSLTGAIAP
jgi:hypothetical protein